jgi:hypothetical protein
MDKTMIKSIYTQKRDQGYIHRVKDNYKQLNSQIKQILDLKNETSRFNLQNLHEKGELLR